MTNGRGCATSKATELAISSIQEELETRNKNVAITPKRSCPEANGRHPGGVTCIFQGADGASKQLSLGLRNQGGIRHIMIGLRRGWTIQRALEEPGALVSMANRRLESAI